MRIVRNLRESFACFLLISSAAYAQGTGYWHTSGNQILDSNGTAVRIAGMNWYGFETSDAVVHGLWAQDYKAILNTVKAQGYNTLRIPFSNQMVESNPKPSNMSYSNSSGPINTDLQGQTALVILDKIIAYCGQIGVRVILDNHRSEAGNSAEENGLWYTSAYPESNWIADWVALANRYNGNTTVIGFDLRNEPHNSATWGDGNTNTDWRAAAQRAGNQVLAVNPNLLIFVEGIQNYGGDYYWWGGNLEGAGSYPVQLNVTNRVVYSPHDYGPHEYGQNWFNGSTSSSSLASVWTNHWAYLSINNIAPVWVGEFGTTNNASDISDSTAGSQGQWFQSMIQFLSAHPSISWTYWALNGEDSYGLLDNNYSSTPASAQKQQALATIQFPLGSGSSNPDFSVGVSPGTQTVTAGSSTSYTVNVTRIGSFSGSVSLTVSGLPPGVTGNFSSATVTPSSAATLTLTTTSSTTAGTYTFTVKGASGSLNHSSSANLLIQAVAAPDFTLSANPSSQSVTAVSAVSYTISQAAKNGFTGTTSFTVTGLPTGASGNFSPATISGSGNTSLTVSTLSSTPGGTYLLTVTGTSGSKSHSTSLTLTVTSGSTGGGACTVTYQISNDWGAGFVTNINLQNYTGSTITNWVLRWTFSGNQTITNLWNGILTQNGNAVTVANQSYNGSISNGGTTQLGFQATYSGVNQKPAAISMNGIACAVN